MKNNNSQSSLADIILVLSKHLILIILVTILALLFTIYYVNKNYHPEYVSTTKMFIPAESGGSRADLGVLAGQFGITTNTKAGYDISSASLYPDIVSSRTFAEIMLDKEFHSEKYEKKLPLIAIFTYGEKPIPDNIDTLRINSAKRIANMVKFQARSGFFIIDVTTNDPQFSKDLADTLIVELDKLQRKFKKQSVNEKIDYIEQKINIAESELRYNEERLKSFRERNRNVSNSPALLLTQERLQRDVEIQKGIFLTLKQQLELAKIEEVQKSSFVQILDYPSIPIKASNSIKRSTYFVGGLMGFFLGIGLAFISEYFSNRNETESKKLKSAKVYAIESFKKLFTFKWLKKNQ